MRLDKKTEEKIKKQALNFIKKSGRTNWDGPHTLCAVKWMKILISHENGNERILIPAIYFHDTGYPKFGEKYTFHQVIAAKKNHAKNAAKNAKVSLPKLGFNKIETERITYLVANHDKHSNITEHDRQLVFEADGLAQIDWKDAKPSFDLDNCKLFLKEYYSERKKYMKTKTGKKYMEELMLYVKEYLNNHKE